MLRKMARDTEHFVDVVGDEPRLVREALVAGPHVDLLRAARRVRQAPLRVAFDRGRNPEPALSAHDLQLFIVHHVLAQSEDDVRMAETIKLAYRGLDPFPCWPWHAMGHLDSLGTVDVKVEG